MLEARGEQIVAAKQAPPNASATTMSLMSRIGVVPQRIWFSLEGPV